MNTLTRADDQLDQSGMMHAIPSAIVDVVDDADGYIQITVQPDGMIHVRGSRHAVALLVTELRTQGVVIQFRELHWCG